MADYSWPPLDEAQQLSGRHSRLDGPVKSTGAAQFAYDKRFDGLLFAKLLSCPHAHARITRLDTAKAEAMEGVAAVWVIQDEGSEIQWAHDEIAAVAATSEERARDALRAIEVEYEVLPHFVDEEHYERAPEVEPAQEETVGDPDAAMAAAAVTVEGFRGMPQIAHMCLEAHGQVALWEGDSVTVWASTQGVSTLPFQFAEPLGVPASNVRIRCDYMGGGFGSKFSPDRWGVVCAELARMTGRPVKLFLDRDQEVAVAGSRPSAYARIKVGADREGRVTAWESTSWGSGGLPGTGATPIPYVFDVPNRRKQHLSVSTHLAGSRAWRAPNHPQACFLTMTMLDDLAAELDLDPVELLRRNLELTPEPLRATYARQLDMAVELTDWKTRWKPRRERRPGPIQRGMGVSLHTWGGRGHRANCEVVVQPDGSVEARIGSQDLGTGTRTVIATVLAESFGLELDQVTVSMGDSRFPQAGPSGGSSTVGGVSGATRRAAQDAARELFARVAPELGVEPERLEARDGRIQLRDDPSRGLAWKEAAALLGVTPITVTGRNPGPGPLNDSGVGGVQIAEVSVDVDTGVVTIERMVAVQDCGLVVNEKLAESQIFGGLIMGVSYALYEEWVPDPVTGRLLNPNMEFYRLAGLVDVGRLEAHVMIEPEHHQRGVIGLGEPPVISPGAAISNAVANAIGVRVDYLPITPARVLEALERRQRSEEVG